MTDYSTLVWTMGLTLVVAQTGDTPSRTELARDALAEYFAARTSAQRFVASNGVVVLAHWIDEMQLPRNRISTAKAQDRMLQAIVDGTTMQYGVCLAHEEVDCPFCRRGSGLGFLQPPKELRLMSTTGEPQ